MDMDSPSGTDDLLLKARARRTRSLVCAALSAVILPVLLFAPLYVVYGNIAFSYWILGIPILLAVFAAGFFFFGTLFDPEKSLSLRRALAVLAVLLVAGALFFAWREELAPARAFRDAVERVPEMETYFARHRNSLEDSRNKNGSDSYFSDYNSDALGMMPDGSIWFLKQGFVYDGASGVETGYPDKHRYVQDLGGGWYLEIDLEQY